MEKYDKLIFNFYEISDNERKIRDYTECNISFYIHGKTGIGKSARIKQMDPTAIIIYPSNYSPDMLNGKTVYIFDEKDLDNDGLTDIKPSWLEKLEQQCADEPDRYHFLFFDELSNAIPSMQAYVFDIMLSHEVNGMFKLPPNARVAAAGNEMCDSLAASEMTKPLFSRLAHIYLEDNIKDWTAWACRSDVHPLVIAFLASQKGECLRTPYTGVSPNADPRKWEMVSNLLKKSGHTQALYTLIDKPIADNLINFCYTSMVPLEDIVANELWNECYEAVKIMKSSDYYPLVANLSRCDSTNIRECARVISLLPSEERSLFDVMWAKGDPARAQLLQKVYIELSSKQSDKSKLYTR